MKDTFVLDARGLGYDYYNHRIFTLLSDLESFYELLSDNSLGHADGLLLTQKLSIVNKIYASMQGSIESIKILVYIGRLNDAFALARKYYDAVTTDIYQSILTKKEENSFLEDNKNLKDLWNNSVVRAWTYAQQHLYDSPSRNNKGQVRTYEDINNALKGLNDNLFKIITDIKSKERKKICNDNMHYNSWDNFVLNVNESFDNKIKIKALDDLFENLQIALCYHFAYIYILHPEYYSSSDYIEALEMGVVPETDSQYWVAPIVQVIFDKYIKTYNQELSEFILTYKNMKFE